MAEGDGQPLSDGRFFQSVRWRPGEEHAGAPAPRVAECVTLAEVDLGDLTQLVARVRPSSRSMLSTKPGTQPLTARSTE